MTLTRKFLRTEQTVPVATVAAPGALFFDSVTHIGTNSDALQRNDATLVPWTLATDPTSKMESVIVYLIVTGVGSGGGIDYGSADVANYANLSAGTIAANGTTAVTVANADLIRVGASVNAAAGSAGSLVVFVTGLRRMYDRPAWEQ